MALIKCPECNKEISDKSNTCVHCGYKFKNNKNYLKIIIVIIIVLVGFSIYLKNSSNDNKKKNNKDIKIIDGNIPYEEIKDKKISHLL